MCEAPSKIDRLVAERRVHCQRLHRRARLDGLPTSVTRDLVQVDDLLETVEVCGAEGPVVSLCRIDRSPGLRKFQPEQLVLEPAILGEGEVLHNAADGQISCGKRSGVDLVQGQVPGLPDDGTTLLVEALRETDPLSRGLEIGVELAGRHGAILAAHLDAIATPRFHAVT